VDVDDRKLAERLDRCSRRYLRCDCGERLRARRLWTRDDHGCAGISVLANPFLERHRAGSIIVTSNRGPDEWLATFADPMRAQSAIDRFTSNAYDLVLDGESYRQRLKPGRDRAQPMEEPRSTKKK